MSRAFFFLAHRTTGAKLSSRDYQCLKEGLRVSEETKEKLSLAFLGKKRKPFTAETKKKMSEARLGIRYTIETRKKMSESAKSRQYKLNHTDEAKAKMSAAAKIREAKKKENGWVISNETRAKLSAASSARVVTTETRAKLAKAARERHALKKAV